MSDDAPVTDLSPMILAGDSTQSTTMVTLVSARKSGGKSSLMRQLPITKCGRLLLLAQSSNVDLFCDIQRVFQFNAKISNCAVNLGVAKQKLHRA
ncbi:hypothetical protein I5192_00255 [Ruegeria sp. SCSIO 43209]|nr:hypothetical protein I5192_00255 [Ruegeria sp. SCSIO 43209]